jgi:hypothetical protein
MVRRLALALAAASLIAAAPPPPRDPANPTCPERPNWTDFREMQLTPVTRNGVRILIAEGQIDAGLPARLRAVLAANPELEEIWLRSPGGDARAGNEAGRIIRALLRDAGVPMVTRIPAGWACFSACNFMFMGGVSRIIEPGGVYMVHMFTFTSDRGAIRYATEQGAEQTIALIGDVEQESALLASEDNDHLLRMGVSRRLLTEIMYQQRAVSSGTTPAQRHCLSIEEATEYNVHAPPRFEE